METIDVIKKIRSIILCLSAHPDNEEHSEFADRIDDLVELQELFQSLQKENDSNVKNIQSLINVGKDFAKENTQLKSDYKKTLNDLEIMKNRVNELEGVIENKRIFGIGYK